MASRMRGAIPASSPTVLKRCRQPWFGATFLSGTTVRANS